MEINPELPLNPAARVLPQPLAESVEAEPFFNPSRSFMARIRVQRAIGFLVCIPFYETIALLFRLGGYRIQNHRELRKFYREFIETARKDRVQVVVCLNHMTYVDSCLTIWAFGSSFWYQKNYSAFSWNLPAGDFFKKKFIFRVVAYLGKCIFIDRKGSKVHKESVLGAARELAAQGEVITIFPEGRRTRTNRFETGRTFGVGKLITGLDNCRVLCVFLRSDKQDGCSSFPPRNSKFRIQTQVLQPQITEKGRKAYFQVIHQIEQCIVNMETEYFKWQ